MSLEEIEGIRAEIRKLEEQREINIIEGREALSEIRKKYSKVVEREGKDYCDKNYSDIPKKVNELDIEFYIK